MVSYCLLYLVIELIYSGGGMGEMNGGFDGMGGGEMVGNPDMPGYGGGYLISSFD